MNFINQFNVRLKITSIILFSFLLTGCGFHIKHSSEGLAAKYPQIYIQSSNPNGDLTRYVKIRLRGAGVQLLNVPSEDAAILRIKGEARSERTISLNVKAQNAEQEMGYNLSYSIQKAGYEVQEFTFSLYRDFLDNPAKALAKSREAEQLTRELREAAADNIVFTLQALDRDAAKKVKRDESDVEKSVNGVAQ